MTVERQSRPVRLTASGLILGRPTRVSAITVTAMGAFDVIVHFHNSLSNDTNLSDGWTVEADADVGSHTVVFEPPLLFTRGVYAEVVSQGDNQAVCVAVIEPTSSGT